MDDESKQQEKKELEDIKTALSKRGYKYEITLGRGSYSRVVQAEHLLDTQKYAIKILPIEPGDAVKYRQRELDVLKKPELCKQNIVRYHGCWPMDIGNDPFLCIQLELCRVNLEAFVYSNEMGNARIVLAKGPPRFYRQVFPQILNGLKAIHDEGLVHRDIHIGNILIANPKPTQINQVNIKIADFGLAREIRSVINASPSLTDAPKLQRLSSGIGNELFRAPELATEDYDYKVDLYSAGIVLYFLSCYLEDKRQWRSEISALKNGERGREHLCHQDDETLFSLITSLLEEDPKKRPSAVEALETFENVQAKRPTESTNFDDGKLKAKRFYLKRDGEVALKRCEVTGDTLFELKAAIESCTGINAESQDLHQETEIDGKEEVFKIESDIEVRCMFQSAEEARKKVFIVVTENALEMDVDNGGLTLD